MIPVISVIIPCYNSEKTIIRCCESLLSQTIISDIEIIIVNDGSQDKTREVVELFIEERKVENITLKNIKNSGVSAARNIGINESRGKYIGFVDSDDTIEVNMFSEMLNYIEGESIDLVMSKFTVGEKSGELQIKNGFYSILNKDDTVIKVIQDPQYQGFVWNKLYKTEIIKINRVSFKPELKIMEDLDFNLNYLQYVRKSVILNNQLYHYCTNQEGVMLSGNHEAKMSIIKNYYCLLSYNLKNLNCLIESHITIYLLTSLSGYYISNRIDEEVENILITELRSKKLKELKYMTKYNKKFLLAYGVFLLSPRLFKKIFELQRVIAN